MADVTISQLTQGIPAGNNILPYSTVSNTLGVPVSAIFQNAGDVRLGGRLAIGAVDDPGPSQYNLELRGANPPRGVMGLVYNNASLTTPNNGAMIQYTQRGLGDWAMGCTAGGINGFSLYRGRGVNSDGTEAMRFDSSGNVEFFGTVKSPGSVVQSVFGKDTTSYNFPNPGPALAPINNTSTINFVKRFASSKVHINISAYVGGRVGSSGPGVGLGISYQDIQLLPGLERPYLGVNGSSAVVSVYTTLTILHEHITNDTNLTYRLNISKNSFAGTGDIFQESARWIIQEIAG